MLCLLGCIAGATPERVDGTTGPPALELREPPVLQTVSLAGCEPPAIRRCGSRSGRPIGLSWRSPATRMRRRSYVARLSESSGNCSWPPTCCGNAEGVPRQRSGAGAGRVPVAVTTWLTSREGWGISSGPPSASSGRWSCGRRILAATVWLGRIYRELGRPQTAGTLIARMLARLPDVPALRVEAGRIALALEDYGSAVGHLEAVLVLDSRCGRGPLSAGHGLPRTGRSGSGGSTPPAVAYGRTGGRPRALVRPAHGRPERRAPEPAVPTATSRLVPLPAATGRWRRRSTGPHPARRPRWPC